MRIGIYAFILLLATGCFKKDEPVSPYPRGDAREAVVEIGEGYNNQVFFSLNSNEVVKTVKRIDWDIAFSCAPGSRVIRLNSSRGMYAADVTGRDLNGITDTSGLEFRWDVSSGNPDSVAIIMSSDSGQFVINMGHGENFEVLGFKKIAFRIKNDELHFTWTDLNNSNPGSGSILKETVFNHQHFSLLNGQGLSIEPAKTAYDIFFTQYIYYFEKEDIPYMVSGVLLNPYKTVAARQDVIPFADYSADDLDPSELSERADVIGYNWKWYNLDEGVYKVDPRDVFTIRTSDGFLYKMHFVDYYNNQGISGFPRLEQQRL